MYRCESVALLDTCALIAFDRTEKPDEQRLRDHVKELQQDGYRLVITSVTKMEFVRGLKERSEERLRRVMSIVDRIVTPTKQDLELAQKFFDECIDKILEQKFGLSSAKEKDECLDQMDERKLRLPSTKEKVQAFIVDMIIAAVAYRRGWPLVTGNVRDYKFLKCKGLKLSSPELAGDEE